MIAIIVCVILFCVAASPAVRAADPFKDFPAKAPVGKGSQPGGRTAQRGPFLDFPPRVIVAPAIVPEVLAPMPPPPSPPPPVAPILAAADKHARYRALWPKTDEPWLDAFRDQVHFYTAFEMPPRFQAWDLGNASGLRSLRANNGTNANNEFPWAQAAGTQRATNTKEVRFVHLPAGKPITWHTTTRSNGTFEGFAWEFPAGTIFGELLLMRDKQGGEHTYELRLREKGRDGKWAVAVYRPFPREADLVAALEARGVRGFVPAPSRPALVSSQRSAGNPGGHTRGHGFTERGLQVELGSFEPDLVATLLRETPFTSARGKPWRKEELGVAHAPTSKEDFGIVPRDFAGFALPISPTSCMRCHQDAGQFVPAGPEPVAQQTESRWRVRGSDGILSFHIFDPASPLQDPNGIRLNPRLVQAGLLAHK